MLRVRVEWRRFSPLYLEESCLKKPAQTTRSTTFCPREIEGFDSLAELALNLRWSWNHATDEVWRQLDPKLWEITHNPWVVLQTVSRDQIERRLADPAFRKNVDSLVKSRRNGAGVARVVSAESCAKFSNLRRVFQHGIHVE